MQVPVISQFPVLFSYKYHNLILLSIPSTGVL